jgi:hypothetical protein
VLGVGSRRSRFALGPGLQEGAPTPRLLDCARSAGAQLGAEELWLLPSSRLRTPIDTGNSVTHKIFEVFWATALKGSCLVEMNEVAVGTPGLGVGAG